MKKHLQILTRLLLLAVACHLSLSAYAQPSVGGKVMDAQGAPLIGATVVVTDGAGNVKGGGTSAGVSGQFSIKATPEQLLLVSFIGYKEKRVPVVEGVTHYDIRLDADAEQIEDVVVVGYGTQKKTNLTGSVATINAESFDKRPIVSTSSALQGMAPGVTVTTQSGAPGADGGSIRIRGINSFGGSSTSPLVLIDGVEGGLDSVDPSLIESISILKDAASASIYGSRAANGVILVTTKRGNKDVFQISYKGYAGWQSPTDLPNTVNAIEFRELTNAMDVNDNRTPTYDAESMDLYRKNMGKDVDLYPNTDWQKTVLQGSGFTNSHTVSMSVGTNRIRMLTTLGYVGQEGIIKNADYTRYSFRNNVDVTFNKKISLKFDISMSYGTRNSSPYQSVIFNYMNTRPADITNIYTTGRYNGLGLLGSNPEALMLFGGSNTANTLRLSGAASLKYQPTKWLTFDGMIAPRYASVNRHNWKKPVTTFKDAAGTATETSAPLATLTESQDRSFYGNYNFLMTAAKNFGSHDLKLIMGTEWNDYDNRYLMAYREGFNYENYDQITSGEILNQNNDGYRYQWAIRSYFGRLNYNFRERYLLEANMRIDGSSRFIKANRWGYFPSVSGAWRITEENFMKDIRHVVNNLKFRASYGTLGNQNLAGSDAESYYPTTQNLATGHVSMNDRIYSIVTLNTLANPDIKWESTTMLDLGVDVTLLDKINITADWYRKNTNDILMTLDIPLGVGLNAPFQNAGRVRNTGWEVSAGYNNKWGDFSFGAQANLSDVKNVIVDMRGQTSTSGVMRNQGGYAIGSIYALNSMGIIRTQEDADWVNANCPQFGKAVNVGDIRYVDVDGNNKVDENDKDMVGSTVPRYTYSLNLDFAWKGLRLGLFLQGVGKVDGYLNYYYVMPSYKGGTFRKEHLNHASIDNPGGTTPRLTTNENNWYDSSFWMKSAAYLRLKNIQIGYDLPSRWMKKVGMKSAFVYVNAQNLFTTTKFWDGYDPEVAYGGSSSGNYDAVAIGGASSANNYPQVKIVTVGLDLKF